MPIVEHQVKFELIPLDKLAVNFVEMVEDERYKQSRARSPKAKRDCQRALNLLASTSFYLQELQKKNDSN